MTWPDVGELFAAAVVGMAIQHWIHRYREARREQKIALPRIIRRAEREGLYVMDDWRPERDDGGRAA